LTFELVEKKKKFGWFKFQAMKKERIVGENEFHRGQGSNRLPAQKKTCRWSENPFLLAIFFFKKG